MKHTTPRGFSIIEVVIVLVVIVMIAGLGYAFFARKDQPLATKDDSSLSQTDTTPEPTREVTAIASPGDLDKIVKELDQLDMDDTSDDASLNSSMSDL